MKIAIPVLNDDGKNSKISEHFGHAPYFAFIILKENGEYKLSIIKNPLEEHGPGDIPNYLHKEGISLLIARGIGGRAITFFEQLGIHVIRGADGTVEEIINDLKEQKLFDREYEVKEKFHNH
ncbi:Dinitrogenase iron-molybdenum cofactor biosynthesis protein [Marinitoga sp. 1197]|uniref:NifB/NifX family molybdenum-iron cluster-binding protein n=1 Tax=unclassified Marinitoga TaxID=2640159 RepID=UPI00064123A0|nr:MULTISPECIES: NifB/NifX family molybdenum-iron cluster-binding protein [unclassified Marinitoga]KLO22015.1 Dinitrogenase iron-molybdenum cofactor biosynthesis protein [Marinitoga sp. 1197]KLO24620.1 Dinitrogenase iron-molybdenum cofactor biosynthesis protein [Marinitoga sp. 1155]NUU98850.1 dinitrogenase iron-molybdenum cofactor biosynthesis protein [Marinitoga sp. 1154]